MAGELNESQKRRDSRWPEEDPDVLAGSLGLVVFGGRQHRQSRTSRLLYGSWGYNDIGRRAAPTQISDTDKKGKRK
jgi:hypothetical protein